MKKSLAPNEEKGLSVLKTLKNFLSSSRPSGLQELAPILLGCRASKGLSLSHSR